MKVLFLCNKSPYPAREGGPIAMKSLIDGLLKAGHKVKVLAVNSEKYQVSEADIPEEFATQTAIELVDVDLRIRPFAALKAFALGQSYHVQRFISTHFRKKLISILKAEKFDVIQLETVFMMPYVDDIRQYSDAPIILRAHNIEHLIWKRIAIQTKNPFKKFYIHHLSKALKKYELQSLNRADGIAAITRKDAAFFRGLTSTPTIDVPYAISPESFIPSFEVAEKPVFFHIGAMNWIPNQEGINWFLEKVWPLVIAKKPDARFILAGRFMPEWLLNYKSQGIEVIGEVDDASDFVRNNDIAVVPLLSGSGIRIKIIEAMAHGKTVLTTSIGAEGINYTDMKDLFIADDPAKMAALIVQLHENSAIAVKTGKAARQLVDELYDNTKVIARLLLFYTNLMAAKNSFS
ncbi:MAG: glycosyltransferase family 4 protein [Bacteroidetes bacterium]|jgi:glycosyltransferase involved in cell wall biosynthesis|nr:glycosyltransferase family 4 protein [Bacteroidota bacterium]